MKIDLLEQEYEKVCEQNPEYRILNSGLEKLSKEIKEIMGDKYDLFITV